MHPGQHKEDWEINKGSRNADVSRLAWREGGRLQLEERGAEQPDGEGLKDSMTHKPCGC